MRRWRALLVVVGASLLSFGGSCGKPKPPVPPQPPIEEPDVPPKGVPTGAERLLRPAPGGRVTVGGVQFDAFLAQPCCNTFTIGGVQKNSRWPMASTDWMDYTHQFGANFFEFRLGPFVAGEIETEWADVGGTYLPGTVTPNEAWWTEVRRLADHAYDQNSWVLARVVDTWGCKADQMGMVGPGAAYTGLPMAEVEACGRRPSPEIERHIRRAVSELGCWGHVVWGTDVEGGNIQGATAEWFLWVQRVIRDEEQKTGCGFVHGVMTNSRIPEVEAAVDFVDTHERTTLSSPIAGRWTANTERNPEFPVQTEVANFKVARDLGLAWAAWRAGMDEATYEAVLKGFQAVVQGAGPPPPPGGCYAPGPDDPGWVTNPPPLTPQQRATQLAAQVSAAKDTVGNRCGKNVQESLALVAGELRRQGLCASGPWVDAVVVRAPDGKWEEHHVVAYTDGCFTLTQNGYKGAWAYSGSSPGQVGCTDPRPPRVSTFNLKCEVAWCDATPLIQSCDYCASIGMGDIGGTQRCTCPTRSECPGFKCEERPACEAVAVNGNPAWRCEVGQVEVKTDNPYQARCSAGAWIEVCHADGATCTRAAL